MNQYRVDIDSYNGPLDLLLFLIRRDEIDIYDIPIARVAEQYSKFVEVLSVIDPNVAGDFIVLLATLMEIKSRAMLPRPAAGEDEEDDFEDPRMELVRQLLAYKSVKDAARELDSAAKIQARRFPHVPVGPTVDSNEMDLDDVNVWALVNAFNTLLEQTGKGPVTHDVVFDDTPLALHADDMVDSLKRAGGSQLFESIFANRTKIEMIGLFLALLELIRRRKVRISQDSAFGPITVHLIHDARLDPADDWAEPESEELNKDVRAADQAVGAEPESRAEAGAEYGAAPRAEPETNSSKAHDTVRDGPQPN